MSTIRKVLSTFQWGLEINQLGLQDRARIVRCLIKGNSLRSTTRMVGCGINTVAKLLVDLGTACAIYQTETLRSLTDLRGHSLLNHLPRKKGSFRKSQIRMQQSLRVGCL